MNLTISEQATLYFYQWEYRNRGYYHFKTPVDIEPPYIPFRYRRYVESRVDDGRVPSLLSSVTNLLLPKPKKEGQEENESVDILPRYIDTLSTLVGFELIFPNGQEISALRNTEFLAMLCSTTAPMSFEIVGKQESIIIQIVCSERDSEHLQSQLLAYFPNLNLRVREVQSFGFDEENDIAIADFGLSDEFMRPISTTTSFTLDPLTSIIATLNSLQYEDIAVLQILFKGITSPLARDITNSVGDGSGGSFFEDAPEMPKCASEKISNPLFSVVMRMATQGNSNQRSEYLAGRLAQSISSVSQSEFNKLIPLSNEGYSYDFHKYNLHKRLSNRLGFILNSSELNTFVHYPNNTVISSKLGIQGGKTKRLPEMAIEQKYLLGINEHIGQIEEVSISDDTFSKHIVIGGATGTGKTHLLKQLINQDVQLQNSAFIIDPHGDLVNDILETIPPDKKDNVIYINIADADYAFGFNLFNADSESEKTVLASDLASAFADSWISSGDRINSVLQKTISTFIYSDKEASILDMKRFLLESQFRNEFIETLDDPILNYYWHNEFPLVRRNELSPLLLRIDSFMQTRLLRNIFCQNKGIDFTELVEQRKIVLLQLSVGLIGFENSKFLARLIIAKINQVAFARQNIAQEKRLPIHLYIDESHNYANSPVIEQILSGARKYKLSLILVLQHLEQVQNDLLNSILANTVTQVFFRQSDKDAKRIAGSFSFFDAEDFMELGRGEALVRILKRSNDFNMKTLPLKTEKQESSIKDYIIKVSRTKYAKSKDSIIEILQTLLPQNSGQKENKTPTITKEIEDVKNDEVPQDEELPKIENTHVDDSSFEEEKEKYLGQVEKKERDTKHLTLQKYIKTLAIQRGYKVTFEKEVPDGRIDVELLKDDLAIAVEISVTNSLDYEVKNIQKCIDAGYQNIYMLSESETHLKNIQKRAQTTITKESLKMVRFVSLHQFAQMLDKSSKKILATTKRVRGYRVKSNQIDISSADAEDKNSTLRNIILKTFKKREKK